MSSFRYIFGDKGKAMDVDTIHDASDRFKAEEEEWEYFTYYSSRLNWHCVDYWLVDNTADTRSNLLLSKVGPEAFRVLVDHFHPENITTKTDVQLKEPLKKHFQKMVCILAGNRLPHSRKVYGKWLPPKK